VVTTHLLGAAAVVAVVLSVSALADATGGAGSVAEVRDQGRKILLTTSDGRTRTVRVSDATTRIVIAGHAGIPEAIKAGMTCTVVGADGGDAAKIDCN
jgi:hypothetical protein